jgi:hypothetical protein
MTWLPSRSPVFESELPPVPAHRRHLHRARLSLLLMRAQEHRQAYIDTLTLKVAIFKRISLPVVEILTPRPVTLERSGSIPRSDVHQEPQYRARHRLPRAVWSILAREHGLILLSECRAHQVRPASARRFFDPRPMRSHMFRAPHHIDALSPSAPLEK